MAVQYSQSEMWGRRCPAIAPYPSICSGKDVPNHIASSQPLWPPRMCQAETSHSYGHQVLLSLTLNQWNSIWLLDKRQIIQNRKESVRSCGRIETFALVPMIACWHCKEILQQAYFSVTYGLSYSVQALAHNFITNCQTVQCTGHHAYYLGIGLTTGMFQYEQFLLKLDIFEILYKRKGNYFYYYQTPCKSQSHTCLFHTKKIYQHKNLLF